MMEAGGENLYDYLNNKTNKVIHDLKEKESICRQILQSIAIIHYFNYSHRDIKPENFIRVGDVFKLCDFGLTKDNSKLVTPKVGTIYYMAPELLADQKTNYTKSVDIWSLGCVFYEIIQGDCLFAGQKEDQNNKQQVEDEILNSKNNNFLKEKIAQLQISDAWKRGISLMLLHESAENQRITADDLQQLLCASIEPSATQQPLSIPISPNPVQQSVEQNKVMVQFFEKHVHPLITLIQEQQSYLLNQQSCYKQKLIEQEQLNDAFHQQIVYLTQQLQQSQDYITYQQQQFQEFTQKYAFQQQLEPQRNQFLKEKPDDQQPQFKQTVIPPAQHQPEEQFPIQEKKSQLEKTNIQDHSQETIYCQQGNQINSTQKVEADSSQQQEQEKESLQFEQLKTNQQTENASQSFQVEEPSVLSRKESSPKLLQENSEIQDESEMNKSNEKVSNTIECSTNYNQKEHSQVANKHPNSDQTSQINASSELGDIDHNQKQQVEKQELKNNQIGEKVIIQDTNNQNQQIPQISQIKRITHEIGTEIDPLIPNDQEMQTDYNDSFFQFCLEYCSNHVKELSKRQIALEEFEKLYPMIPELYQDLKELYQDF